MAKALKKNPQERYISVTALADDLRRFLRTSQSAPDRTHLRIAPPGSCAGIF